MSQSKIFYFYFSLLILSILLMTGCSFSKLKQDLDTMETYVTLKGDVLMSEGTAKGPVVVVVIQENSSQPRLLKHQILNTKGRFEFSVPQGRYRVFAWEDKDQDMRYRLGERAGHSEVIEAKRPGTRREVTIHLSKTLSDETKQRIDKIRKREDKSSYFTTVTPGTRISLDAPAFSQENITKGLWQPLEFIKTIPFGLFFLEAYDPEKIPILFVHGVSGSPSHFRYLISRLDRSRFQPWVYYYPSGFSITLVGKHLKNQIAELHIKYGFTQLKVVAHSMGGLVSRSFMNEYHGLDQGFDINGFISISTPWAGHNAASAGLKYAPAVIPVWQDIAPESDFMTALFSTPMPGNTPHYLIFGFNGTKLNANGSNDGVVSIASQLRMEAQKEARLVRGFNETHTSILESPGVSDLILQIIEPSP